MSSWISLAEYSKKYQISVSTLRRKIKANVIPFKQEGKKYLVPNAPYQELLEHSFVNTDAHTELSDKGQFLEGNWQSYLLEIIKSFNEVIKYYKQEMGKIKKRLISLEEEVAEKDMLIEVLEEELKNYKNKKEI